MFPAVLQFKLAKLQELAETHVHWAVPVNKCTNEGGGGGGWMKTRGCPGGGGGAGVWVRSSETDCIR